MLYEIIAYHLPPHRTTIISVLTLRRSRSLERRIDDAFVAAQRPCSNNRTVHMFSLVTHHRKPAN